MEALSAIDAESARIAAMTSDTGYHENTAVNKLFHENPSIFS